MSQLLKGYCRNLLRNIINLNIVELNEKIVDSYVKEQEKITCIQFKWGILSNIFWGVEHIYTRIMCKGPNGFNEDGTLYTYNL